MIILSDKGLFANTKSLKNFS